MKNTDFEIIKDVLNILATAPINQMCCSKCDHLDETTYDWHTHYLCADCGKNFSKVSI